ncbi:hypothetical protein BDY21DRAFT_364514 [Lineolata rhizophorae]|uniref:Uncharacterized protein n=1 Tax=Lineolata rhizophorae TaxID=578093 RepID=A0A6A6NZN3_9PEZI|nr:hypothetical protein BDY21DRAFT_364514 [Lineolata rhizophorae]
MEKAEKKYDYHAVIYACRAPDVEPNPWALWDDGEMAPMDNYRAWKMRIWFTLEPHEEITRILLYYAGSVVLKFRNDKGSRAFCYVSIFNPCGIQFHRARPTYPQSFHVHIFGDRNSNSQTRLDHELSYDAPLEISINFGTRVGHMWASTLQPAVDTVKGKWRKAVAKLKKWSLDRETQKRVGLLLDVQEDWEHYLVINGHQQPYLVDASI